MFWRLPWTCPIVRHERRWDLPDHPVNRKPGNRKM
jgi:hypothetical protein